MQIPPDTARIDLEKSGQSILFIRLWKKGYNTDDAGAPDKEDLLEGALSLNDILAYIENQGFSVTVTGASARCLRGPVTRIDFVKQADGWHLKKFPAGWRATTRPMSDVIKTEDEIKQAIQWCKQNGWTVRENQGFSRAWKGAPKPVRTAEATRRMRAKATPDQRFADFAYDF